MKCPRCEYEWAPKTLRPKECPRCKGRLDYQPGVVGTPKTWKKKEVRKAMPSKLPWATAATIIVIAAVGAWALWPAAEVPPVTPTPTPGAWTQFVWAWPPDNTGIENVYFMDSDKTYDNAENFSGHENIIYGKNEIQVVMRNPAVEATPFTDNLHYGSDNNFDIVVTVMVYSADVASTYRENIKIELTVTEALTIGPENKTGTDLTVTGGYTEGGDMIKATYAWDNDTAGYYLDAGENITLTVRLYLWK